MKQSQHLVSLVGFILFSFVFGGSQIAWGGPSPVAPVNVTEGLALKGYDPVAYFTIGKPTPGMTQFTHHWQGATYRFASNENLERFKAEPEKYLPQYGGYCAYALSINRIADIGSCSQIVDERSLDGGAKLIAIHKEANHGVVHEHGFGETNCFSGETLDPRS